MLKNKIPFNSAQSAVNFLHGKRGTSGIQYESNLYQITGQTLLPIHFFQDLENFIRVLLLGGGEQFPEDGYGLS